MANGYMIIKGHYFIIMPINNGVFFKFITPIYLFIFPDLSISLKNLYPFQ